MPRQLTHEIEDVLARASSPVVRAACDYWLRKRQSCGRPLPGRQHIDPAEMSGFLAHVALFDVVRSGVHCRFRYRLSGTESDRISGRNATGLFIEHTESLENFDSVYRRFVAVAEERMLVFGVSASPTRDLEFDRYEHLTLPLATDGETVDMLFGVRCALGARHDIHIADMAVPLLAGTGA